jgi:glyoxylase-like metal-dependent hydrolase (beta-lactamase superfamily II)
MLAASAFGAPVAAQQPPPTFPQSLAELTRLNEDTYAFRSGGYVSMFITTDEGVIVVDPIGGGNNVNNPQALKAAIATVTDQPVRYLIYSHAAADHGSGGEVFAETAEFVGHRNTLAVLEAANDPRRPVPTIAFDESLALELGGKTVELRWAALGPRDNYLTVHYRNVLMAVDNLRIRSIAFSDLPFASGEGNIAFIERLEADPNWEFFLYGHSSGPVGVGTRDDVRQYREYLEDLLVAIRAARAAGHADNSDEMVAAVRGELAERYGTWDGFANNLGANIRGVIRWWSM